MHTLTILRLSLYLLMFLGNESLLRPLQEKRSRRNDWYKNDTLHENKRVGRSIPDMDAVNPAYFDIESQPDQEQPMDPRGDISQFSLTDQVGNLFRSHKLGKNAQKTHVRPIQSERAVNLRVEEQSMVDGRLPADEQEECYKQQNIESPSQEGPPKVNWANDQEPQAMPSMENPQELQTWPAKEGSHVFNENLGHMLGRQEVEKQEVDSLYSDPEQVLKLKKVKAKAKEVQSPEGLSEYNRAYKPVGVQAEFPVYDEDLDFHPDPLQGILDDKYWLDPQEQEAVIRKYIDLAANNMMLPGMDYGKRNVDKGDHRVKSVNSKIGFKDVDSQCPCKEISACGDCSKGKKKTNYSDISRENIVYGRKLLSIYEIPDILTNEIKSEINEDTPKRHNAIGRRLLWNGVDDEDEELYNNEDDEDVENSHSVLGEISTNRAINRAAVNWFQDKQINAMSKHDNSGLVRDKYTSDDSHKKFDFNNITFNNNQFNQGLKQMEMTLFKAPNKPPGFYTSNKLGNMIQKPFQEKAKGPKKNQTDPDYKFEVVKNQTLYNATFEATSEKPPRPKICFKRGSRNDLNAPKNRRSFSNLSLIGKNHQEVPLFQSPEGSMGSDYKGGNGMSTTSKQPAVNTSQSQPINCTSASTNLTTVSPNKTSHLISNHSKQSLKSNFDDRGAEESVDAEVANDIVETVISESEKSAVLGHNLGICKRNESVTKMKYGQIVPEAEKVLKSVTDCILDRIKAHLALQSCILLDDELLEFLKWMVLSGESYKEYMQRLGPKYYDFVPVTTVNVTTCGPPTPQTCEQEPLPPNPNVVSSLGSNSAKVYR